MIEFEEFVIRVLFAAACGLVVGLDREIKGKPLGAGVYVLVAIGSAALMTVTLNFALSSMAEDEAIAIDPTRLIQGIVGGIGFLGAGAIMSPSKDGRLKGVRSGAAIWAVGSIGVACGLGFLKEGRFHLGIDLRRVEHLRLAAHPWPQLKEFPVSNGSSCLVTKLSHYISLSDVDLKRLAALEKSERTFGAGEEVYQGGDVNNDLYVVKHGWAFSYTDLPDGRSPDRQDPPPR